MTIMTLDHLKIAVVLAWALGWGVVAVSPASSVGTWILVVASGVLPPFMISRMRHPPARTAYARIPRQ